MTLRFTVTTAQQITLGTAPGPQVIIGVSPIPPELVTYYAGSVPNAKTPPETVVAVNQYLDGHGNYTYQAMIVDSSATPVTSLANGAVVGGVVNEAGRFAIDPGAVLGGARYQTFTDEMITILTSSADGTTLLATQKPGNAFHRFSINTRGTMGWGEDGTALTDAYLTRIPGAGGDMELAPYLQVRGFFALTDPLYGALQDGDADLRWMVLANGTMFAGDGTAVPPWQFLPDNEAITHIAPAGTQNINTTTFTSVTGVSCSFTKHYAGTRIRVEIIAQGFTSAVDNVVLAVLINGTDTTVDTYRFNAINDHRKFGGFVAVSGVPAGTYTVQARLSVGVGTTTFTTGASVAGWSISAREIV